MWPNIGFMYTKKMCLASLSKESKRLLHLSGGGGGKFHLLCKREVFWIFSLNTRIPLGMNFEWDVSYYYDQWEVFYFILFYPFHPFLWFLVPLLYLKVPSQRFRLDVIKSSHIAESVDTRLCRLQSLLYSNIASLNPRYI